MQQCSLDLPPCQKVDTVGMATTAPVSEFGVIGRDARGFGRVVRLAVGLLLLTGFAIDLWHGDLRVREIPLLLVGAAGLAVFYIILMRLLGDALARVNPWIATVVVHSPLALAHWGALPQSLTIGVPLYIGASQVLQAGTGYGGCEMVAIPALLLRRRYVVYCSLNAVDLVERPTRFGRPSSVRPAMTAVALLLLAYFLFFRDVLWHLGVDGPSDRPWALLLVIPAAALVVTAHGTWSASGRRPSRAMTDDLVGAAILVVLALVFMGAVDQSLVFAGLLLGSLALLLIRHEVRRRRHGKDGPAGG